MQLSLLFIMAAFLVSCASTPKGDYTRTHIDRPYSLPGDVSSSDYGFVKADLNTDDYSDDVLRKSSDDSASTITPVFNFENGLSKSVSWLYPIGVKWSIYNNEKHTIGFSFVTAFLISKINIDYWYRLTNKISLRPFYDHTRVTAIIFDSETNITGLETIYQHNKYLALSLSHGQGSFVGGSSLLDAIFEDATGKESEDLRMEGVVTATRVGGIYSLSDTWDIDLGVSVEKTVFDDFTTTLNSYDLVFSHYY